MIVSHLNCPACGSWNIRQVVDSTRYPAILFPIEKTKRARVAVDRLSVMGCNCCDHLFLGSIDTIFNSKIYSEYYYLYPYSDLESMEEPYRKPFEKVFRLASQSETKSSPSLLEIGCSSEQELSFFKNSGFKCTGISPGAVMEKGNSLIDGFYENTLFPTQFNCIVSRFNLEHIINVESFLSKVYTDLHDGGLFFVQVPNIKAFLNAGVLGVFAHEHPHYFSCKSLTTVLERSGLSIEILHGDSASPSIITVARKTKSCARAINRATHNLSYAETVIDMMLKEDSRFAFYGAGLSLCTMLYTDKRLNKFSEKICVVDDNPILVGRYLPHTNIEIAPLTSITAPDQTVLFVFLNAVYHSRVLKNVCDYGFKRIYCLDQHGLRLMSHDT
jgi:hypothetical protein